MHSDPAPHSYRTFGLRIASDLPLPGLTEAYHVGDSDVWVRLCSDRAPEEAADARWTCIHEISDPEVCGRALVSVELSTDRAFYRVSYLDGQCYYLSGNGRRVWVCPPSAAHPADTVSYLLGPILGLLLRLRGGVVLHASAVLVGSQALVLVGPSGAGKSTLAASLASLGHQLVTDDLLPIVEKDQGFFGLSGDGRLRLWSDSARVMARSEDELSPVSHSSEKRYLDAPGHGADLAESPVPLGRVYLLRGRVAQRNGTQIESLPPGQTVMELLANTFAGPLVPRHLRASELSLLGRLAAAIPMRTLAVSDDLLALAEASRTLVEDMADA